MDLAAARSIPVRAASAGTVTTVRCDVPDGYSCDVNGGPDLPGCGWYVDLEHDAGIVTRYCHLLAHPTVTIGEQVTVGGIIGLVGSSGNSSGPHLHYEVHTAGSGESSTAIDPVAFMRQTGAPLGQP